MKHFMIAATALVLLAGPTANAQPANPGKSHTPEAQGQVQKSQGQPTQRQPTQRQPTQRQPTQGQQQQASQKPAAKVHEGQWHEQSGQRDNGRHLGWGRNRGANNHWVRGQQMGYDDWRNAQRLDYRRYRLRQPPRGYEWRRTDDRFILASPTTGRIISVVMANGR